MRKDLLVTGIVVAVCAGAILPQLDYGSAEGTAIRPLAMGEPLAVDFRLFDLGDPPRLHDIARGYGPRATVLYTWSVPCPCIEQLEARMRAVHARFNPEGGVHWIALAGEPDDRTPEMREKEARVGGFYRLLRDPEQQICRRLGLRYAAMVAVLDREGRLVYRGSIDADYDEGRAEHLSEALRAVVAGRAPPAPERPWVYGCEFGVPESCLEYER